MTVRIVVCQEMYCFGYGSIIFRHILWLNWCVCRSQYFSSSLVR